MGKKPITQIANQIENGRPIPERWPEGEIVYIYKNKGDAGEFGNYRPICLTQIIYKIRPALIARKLTKIMHIVTSNNQYGYKKGFPRQIQYPSRTVHRTGRQQGESTINGHIKSIWRDQQTASIGDSLKKGPPEEMIRHIRRGHQGAKLAPKYRGMYGEAKDSNVGGLQ